MVDLDYLKTYSEVQSTKIRWIYEMSNTRKKIASVLEWLIGIALALCLFLGGLGFIGFVVAFCMGEIPLRQSASSFPKPIMFI